jgi:hypothetical protein
MNCMLLHDVPVYLADTIRSQHLPQDAPQRIRHVVSSRAPARGRPLARSSCPVPTGIRCVLSVDQLIILVLLPARENYSF